MDDFDEVKPLTTEDRKSLSDLSNTFDLGTQSLISLDMDEENFKEKMFTPMSDYVYNDQVKDPNFYRYKNRKPI